MSPALSLWAPLLVLALPACQASTCEEMSTGMGRDQCFHDRIAATPPGGAASVVDSAAQIQDPMVRGAAVLSWVKVNGSSVSSSDGQKLCAFLEGRDQSYCQRVLSSPHLQR